MHPEVVKIGIEADSLEELARKLVMDMKQIQDKYKETIISEILKREEGASTAIGNGIAIPHCKTPHVEGVLMACCSLAKPLEFPGGKKIDLIFLIISYQHNTRLHLQVLSKVAKLSKNLEVLDSLRNSQSDEDFRKILNDSL